VRRKLLLLASKCYCSRHSPWWGGQGLKPVIRYIHHTADRKDDIFLFRLAPGLYRSQASD